MLAVVRGVGATLANGALPLVYQDSDGILRDIYSAAFQVFTGTLVQIFPATVDTKSTVDVAISGASRAGVGRYNALWASAATLPIGRYYVRWFVVPSLGATEISFDQEFEVLSQPYTLNSPHYCALYDLREEGLLATTLDDAAAMRAIVRASRYVEMYTGRTFTPVYRTIDVDGGGGRALLLNEPIVAVESISVSGNSLFTDATDVLDLNVVNIYNRHLRGVNSPNDRDAPRIEFSHGNGVHLDPSRAFFGDGLVWGNGRGNVRVTGIFGFTEADGSFVGHTPDLIREACKLFVFTNLSSMSITGGVSGSGPLIHERTRDQEVTYATLRTTAFTGNRAVDVLLVAFRRPPSMGAA
jgi:hypothetical protein